MAIASVGSSLTEMCDSKTGFTSLEIFSTLKTSLTKDKIYYGCACNKAVVHK